MSVLRALDMLTDIEGLTGRIASSTSASGAPVHEVALPRPAGLVSAGRSFVAINATFLLSSRNKFRLSALILATSFFDVKRPGGERGGGSTTGACLRER